MVCLKNYKNCVLDIEGQFHSNAEWGTICFLGCTEATQIKNTYFVHESRNPNNILEGENVVGREN